MLKGIDIHLNQVIYKNDRGYTVSNEVIEEFELQVKLILANMGLRLLPKTILSNPHIEPVTGINEDGHSLSMHPQIFSGRLNEEEIHKLLDVIKKNPSKYFSIREVIISDVDKEDLSTIIMYAAKFANLPKS